MEYYEDSFANFLESWQNHTPTEEEEGRQHDELMMQYIAVINASYFNPQDAE